MKDWTGNARSAHATLGARNYAKEDRQRDDYYATEPKALKLLLEKETFNSKVWECACGEGHLSKVLVEHGYETMSTDLVYRGYGVGGVDFLKLNLPWEGDIITNPPYKYAQQFVEHALDLIGDGCRVAMFLKVQFLEGKARRKMFEKHPMEVVYVSSSRLRCAMNGDFDKYAKSNAVSYAWFIWKKGYTGEPVIRWFN